VVRVGGRRVATNAANFTRGDVVGVVLDADQGEIVFFRNGGGQPCARVREGVAVCACVSVCVFMCFRFCKYVCACVRVPLQVCICVCACMRHVEVLLLLRDAHHPHMRPLGGLGPQRPAHSPLHPWRCAGVEQGRARGIRGRLYPFVSCDSEADQVTLLGSYSLLLDRIPRQVGATA